MYCDPAAPAGQGDDEVGAFTIAGEINHKRKAISFVKQYVGQHAVYYDGLLCMEEGDHNDAKISGTEPNIRLW
jgi:hypothetical protein